MQASLERLRKRREEEGDEGFTLIELLIVIVILGILAAIVVFAVQNLTSSSAQASCGSDLKTVQTATEAYKAQMGNYPEGGGTTGQTAAANSPTDIDPNANTVNAAAAATGAGSELLLGSDVGGGKDSLNNATQNLLAAGGAPGVGPWLKSVPANPGHYTIWVANDGTGTVTVVPSGGTGPGTFLTCAAAGVS